MKLLLAGFVLILTVGTEAQWNFPIQAAQGAHDMWKAFRDLHKSNWVSADKYFHARGNFDAAQRGPGGKWIAKVISDAREAIQGLRIQGGRIPGLSSSDPVDSAADQEANRWGRNGGDPNCYRPEGLPDEY